MGESPCASEPEFYLCKTGTAVWPGSLPEGRKRYRGPPFFLHKRFLGLQRPPGQVPGSHTELELAFCLHGVYSQVRTETSNQIITPRKDTSFDKKK